VEYIPIVNGGGKPEAFVAIVNDIVKSVDRRGVRWWFWLNDIAVDVTNNVKNGLLMLGEILIDLNKLFDSKPWLFAKTIRSLDHYTQFIEDLCRHLKNSKVCIAFSGGKDSTIALAVLLKLSERIGFELDAVYVHMPFIEPERNVSEAIRIARKLGVELAVIEPPRREVLRELYRRGLPKRGCRICTYFKVAPLRFRAKALGIDIQAYGDRMWEAGKRFERLFLRFFVKKRLVSKHLGFTVIAPLTIVDVVEQCRNLGLVHYMYLRGAHRVSCVYCPQKPIFELKGGNFEVEDPGTIDEVIKKEWMHSYAPLGIDFESFVEFHLWRFTPAIAKTMFLAKKRLEKAVESGDVDTVKARDFLNQLKSVWIHGIEAPYIGIENVFDTFRAMAMDLLKKMRESVLLRAENS